MTSNTAQASNPQTGIWLDSLSLRRGDRLLIENLTLSVESGQLLYLTGHNGVGKTSLLLALAGFLKPEQGSIQCDRPAFMHMPDGASKGLSVTEDLTFYAHLHRKGLNISETLEKVGLNGDTQHLRTEGLSLGQRKRLNFAKILIADSPIWLLDEPFSALDEAGQRFVENTLSDHLSSGGICVIATHLPRKIKTHTHRSLHLSEGSM